MRRKDGSRRRRPTECEDPGVDSCTCADDRPDEHDRHVMQVPEQDRAQGTWTTDGDPNAAVVMMTSQSVAFVKALLRQRGASLPTNKTP
jgi:hypothetical protein